MSKYERQFDLFLYKVNKVDYDRQKKQQEQAELQASGKFPRRKGLKKVQPKRPDDWKEFT